ncbi:MAG: endolytic transglycosylase MltG [Deltaproteobacteria bacterium]|nr:endolytic transglycosylase MltG [Deltaproteobacteria bacterium]
MKKIGIILIIVFILLVVTSVVLVGVGYYLNESTDKSSEKSIDFNVEKGSSFNLIVEKLEEAELIRSALFLKVYNRLTGSSSLIKTGTYSIEKKLTSLGIIKQLVDGRQKLVFVVIPEGKTIRGVASILSEAGITGYDDFVAAAKDGSYLQKYDIDADSLEGFLFPDTYSFQKDFPASVIVKHMVDLFFDKLNDVYPDYTMLTGQQIYNKIVLSSIIEREYYVADEAAMMASVFYNRLDKGWRLQSCATIVYVITEELKKNHPGRLFYSDLEIDSRFNTYMYYGLPPAPIANPGLIALDAVFSPAQTEYMFFVVNDTQERSHYFSKNLSDHNKVGRDYVSNFRSK